MPVKIWCQILNLPKLFLPNDPKSSLNIFPHPCFPFHTLIVCFVYFGHRIDWRKSNDLSLKCNYFTWHHCIVKLLDSLTLSSILKKVEEHFHEHVLLMICADCFLLLLILSKWGHSNFWTDFGDWCFLTSAHLFFDPKASKMVKKSDSYQSEKGCWLFLNEMPDAQEDSLSDVIQQVLAVLRLRIRLLWSATTSPQFHQ